MRTTLFPYQNLLLHGLFSIIVTFITTTFSLPVRLLEGLHTYIHPENLGNDGSHGSVRAAIRRPESSERGGFTGNGLQSSQEVKKRGHRSKEKIEFDESNAQIYRLLLVDGHIRSRLYFTDFNLVSTYSIVALSNLLLHQFMPAENGEPLVDAGAAIPVGLGFLAISKLLLTWGKVSLERSASRRSEKQSSVLLGVLGFLFVLLAVSDFGPSCFDFEFRFIRGFPGIFMWLAAGCVTGFLYLGAGKTARSIWLGTDQLRWNFSVISCGTFGRMLIYAHFLIAVFASSLWINPIVSIFVKKEAGLLRGSHSNKLAGHLGMVRSDFVSFRIWCLVVSAVLQLLVLRPMLQMFLNEAVLSWYQRLHSSKVPDLDFSRAKMFLHNYYLCLVALQFLAAPTLVLLCSGISGIRGNIFGDFPFIRSLEHFSSAAKEAALFMAWWVMFVWTVFISASLMLFRVGFASIS